MNIDYDAKIEKILNNDKDDYKKAMALLSILQKELGRFDYNKNFSKLSRILININKICSRLPANKQKIINNEIVKLHPIVKNLIKNRPPDVKNNNINFIELKLIIDNLEGMDLSYMYNYGNKYDGNAHKLIYYLLFEEKNLFFVNYALHEYPHFINIKGENDNFIILDIVDKYIEAVDSYINSGLRYSDDLFYYDQVLEIIFSSPKIYYPRDMAASALEKVKTYLDNYDYSKLSSEAKRKFIFWTNELKEKLENNKNTETLSHLTYKTDITIDFDEAVLSEVKRFNIKNLRQEYEKREMIRNEYIITIDGEGAEEIDDGLSVSKLENGNYLLGVHISSPTAYLNKNSILYDEAFKRTTSIYSPLERTSSMFPEMYAKYYMSLYEGENRFSTSYYLEITPDGEILLDRCLFKKSIVNVNKKMTYDEFNELAQKGTTDEKINETIAYLQEVTNALGKRIKMDENYRLANRIITNASGTNVIGNSSSEKIVEYAMIATGCTVANYAAKKGIPFIYRGHELSKEYLDKINHFDKMFHENPTSDNYDVFVKLLKDTYPTAFYTTDSNISHMGIGVKHYSHVTSPLRRFADCLNNEALELFYFNEPPEEKKVYQFEERLKEGCQYINEKKKTIDYFTKRYVKVKEDSN